MSIYSQLTSIWNEFQQLCLSSDSAISSIPLCRQLCWLLSPWEKKVRSHDISLIADNYQNYYCCWELRMHDCLNLIWVCINHLSFLWLTFWFGSKFFSSSIPASSCFNLFSKHFVWIEWFSLVSSDINSSLHHIWLVHNDGAFWNPENFSNNSDWLSGVLINYFFDIFCKVISSNGMHVFCV